MENQHAAGVNGSDLAHICARLGQGAHAAQAQIATTTSASAEAWSLALKNGFIFFGWTGSDSARRTYGCLFGLTSDGSNTYPVVPRAVSVAGLIQNVLSAVLIFLLLLGIRNLLKLK